MNAMGRAHATITSVLGITSAMSAAFGLVLAAGDGAQAQQIVSTGQSFLSAELAVGSRHDDGRRDAGLVMEIKPGWKTYWRAPGEAGVPPRLDWSRSRNLSHVAIDWPRPEMFESFGYMTLGYGGRVVLPLTLTPEDPARPITLALEADVGVCRDICVFETVQIERAIAPDDPDKDRTTIGVARLMVPEVGATAGVSLVSCRITGAGEARDFTAQLSLPSEMVHPYVVLEGPQGSWFDDLEMTPAPDGYTLTATFHAPDGSSWIDRDAIVATVLGETRAAEVWGCSTAG
ncbi:MAG: protein-disulfide reductase DsbD domain-containing protein [Pseudomonadota bacterium]